MADIQNQKVETRENITPKIMRFIYQFLLVLQIAKEDLKAINDYIGNRKYLTGDTVCNEDSALFGILAQMYYLHCGEISDFLLTECSNIVRYLDTIRDDFWPDWQDHIRSTPVSSFEFFLDFVKNQF